MNLRNRHGDLLLVAFLALISPFLAIYEVGGPIRALLGLAYILLAPGYALLVLLFPLPWTGAPGARRGGQPTSMQRLAWSVALSAAISPLLGLLIALALGELKLIAFLSALSAFVLACAAGAWARRRAKGVRPGGRIGISPKDGRVLPALVAIGVLLVVGLFTSGYLRSTPADSSSGIAFYVEPAFAQSITSARLTPGSNLTLSTNVSNHEAASLLVRARAVVENETYESPTTTIAPGATVPLSIALTVPGTSGAHRVEITLERAGSNDTLRTLELWITVTGPGP